MTRRVLDAFVRGARVLVAGEAELGVCIHEGRFTWREAGLQLHEDLGQTWERASGAPLPLGGIVARRELDPELRRRVQALREIRCEPRSKDRVAGPAHQQDGESRACG